MCARTLQAVLFDLGGTLIDTVADIGAALNRALAEQHLTSLTGHQVRELIGRGVPTLIDRVAARLAAAGESADAALLLERFHFHYERIPVGEIQTSLYPGVAHVLSKLYCMGLRLGVVTNRPRDVASGLLERLGLIQWIEIVVGGDSCAFRKPHPHPLLSACEALQVRPSRALMVGDSLTDVLAARAAGLAVVCVPHGFSAGIDARALPCDAFVQSVADLPTLLVSPQFLLEPSVR